MDISIQFVPPMPAWEPPTCFEDDALLPLKSYLYWTLGRDALFLSNEVNRVPNSVSTTASVRFAVDSWISFPELSFAPEIYLNKLLKALLRDASARDICANNILLYILY